MLPLAVKLGIKNQSCSSSNSSIQIGLIWQLKTQAYKYASILQNMLKMANIMYNTNNTQIHTNKYYVIAIK